MPKQGQFARSSQTKTSKRRYQVKHGATNDRQIDPAQAGDFLLVRFALTTKKRLPQATRETTQRFLQELTPSLLADGQADQAVAQALAHALSRVPWQYFYQVSQNWPELRRFLSREVPAIPLAQSVLVKDLPTEAELNAMIAERLATQIAALTMLQANPAASQALAKQLQGQLLPSPDAPIAWSTVAQLLAPFPFQVSAELDEGTAEWLTVLSRVTVTKK